MADLILLQSWQDSQTEIWLPTNYYGYEVSNFGRVRSFWKRRSLLREGCGSETFLGSVPRILKLARRTGGYSSAAIARNKKGRPAHVDVHRLVALVFVPNPNNYPQVNHKNGIKIDNRDSNLEWVLPKQNIAHALVSGLWAIKGEANPMAMLTEDDIRSIRRQRLDGVPRGTVASQFNTTKGNVWAIERYKSWAHVT